MNTNPEYLIPKDEIKNQRTKSQKTNKNSNTKSEGRSSKSEELAIRYEPADSRNKKYSFHH